MSRNLLQTIGIAPTPLHAFDSLDRNTRIEMHRAEASHRFRASFGWVAGAVLSAEVTSLSPIGVAVALGCAILGGSNGTQSGYHSAEANVLVASNMQKPDQLPGSDINK
jgi:hypothetical protein